MNRVGMPAALALEQWADEIEAIFGEAPWLVGSAVRTRDYHDVDIRLMLDDLTFEHWCGRPRRPYSSSRRWRGLCQAFSAWGTAATGLPIDFQIQRDCETQVSERGGPRVPLVWLSDDETVEDWEAHGETLRERLQVVMHDEMIEREKGREDHGTDQD